MASISQLTARLIDLFGSPATANPSKLAGNLTVSPNGNILVGQTTDDGVSKLQATGQAVVNNGPFVMNGPAATYRITYYQSGTSQRWVVGTDNVTETGSNAGSNWFINRYNDSGVFIDQPFNINRATGTINLGTNGARITSNMSDSTVKNRLAFQTSTPNTYTSLNVLPNGTGTEASICVVPNSDPTNAPYLALDFPAGIGYLNCGAWGTGSYNPLGFFVGGAERMRFDTAGNALFGSTAYLTGYATGANQANGKWLLMGGASVFQQANDACIYVTKGSGYSNGTLMQFNAVGNSCGSISTGGTTVSYNTSSDYRLKENVKPMMGALDRLLNLKPSTFNFKSDPDKTVVDGFIAHEVAEVVPEAVQGEKDAVQYVPVLRDGADPNNVLPDDVIDVIVDPVIQQLDHSKLVPLLVGAVQQLSEQVRNLQSQVQELQNK